MSDQTTMYEAALTEFTKLGFSPRVGAALGTSGALGGVGVLGGALIGAGKGGYDAYHDAKANGATTGQALGSGFGGALSNVGKGALVGAGVGAGAGAGLGALAPATGQAVRGALTTAPSAIGAAARMGQRQVHAVTGWHPGGGNIQAGMNELRHGGYDARTNLAKLRDSGTASAGALERASKSVTANETAENMGLTNIPGYLSSMKNNGVGNTLHAAFNQQVHGTDALTKGLMFGVPAAGLVQTGLSHDDPDNPNPQGSKSVRMAKQLANIGAGAALGPLPQLTQMAVQHPIEKLTGYGVAGLSSARGRARAGRELPAGQVQAPQ